MSNKFVSILIIIIIIIAGFFLFRNSSEAPTDVDQAATAVLADDVDAVDADATAETTEVEETVTE